MAQSGLIIQVRTDKDIHFTGALAQNAQATENIVPAASIAAGLHCRSRLRSIGITSKENLSWEIALYGTDQFNSPTDMDSVIRYGWWTFDAASATRVAATGNYYYYVDGLDVAYRDADQTGEIHLALINRSAAGKTAGADGEIVIVLGLDPTQGW